VKNFLFYDFYGGRRKFSLNIFRTFIPEKKENRMRSEGK
jgi:hypothetical protein